MNILLDEGVPWPLRRLLPGHDCTTPPRQGREGFQNGEVIRRAEGRFDLFIPSDQNLRCQQNLTGRRLDIP